MRFSIFSSLATENIAARDAADHPGPRVRRESEAGETADAQAVLEDPGVLHVADGDGDCRRLNRGISFVPPKNASETAYPPRRWQAPVGDVM